MSSADASLECNQCRRMPDRVAWITNCSHFFCNDCGKQLGQQQLDANNSATAVSTAICPICMYLITYLLNYSTCFRRLYAPSGSRYRPNRLPPNRTLSSYGFGWIESRVRIWPIHTCQFVYWIKHYYGNHQQRASVLSIPNILHVGKVIEGCLILSLLFLAIQRSQVFYDNIETGSASTGSNFEKHLRYRALENENSWITVLLYACFQLGFWNLE